MAYTSLSSSSLDSEVSSYSKACLKSYETLKEHYDNLKKDFNKSELNLGAYKEGLESVEAGLEVYKKNKAVFEVDIKILKLDVMFRDNAITELRHKFEKAKKERDDLKLTLEKFEGSSKNLGRLLDSQQCDKSKTCLGYDSQGFDSQVLENKVNDKYNIGEGYHAVPPPYTRNFMPPKPNLAFVDEHVVSESITSLPSISKSKVKTSESKLKTISEPIIEDWVLDLEKAKTAQAKEIADLKKRKLERKKKSRTSGLKRLWKIGSTTRVESSEDKESLGDQEDASKQGRMIDIIDQDEEIALVDETQGRMNEEEMFRVNDLDGDEVIMDAISDLIEIKQLKPKARGLIVKEPSEFRTTSSSQPLQLLQDKDKGKGIMVECEKPLKKEDQIAFDEEVTKKLEAQMKAEMEKEERIAREKDEANITVIEQWDEI
nr:hypothetical protein [Tanacetum cinerariifolium]